MHSIDARCERQKSSQYSAKNKHKAKVLISPSAADRVADTLICMPGAREVACVSARFGHSVSRKTSQRQRHTISYI